MVQDRSFFQSTGSYFSDNTPDEIYRYTMTQKQYALQQGDGAVQCIRDCPSNMTVQSCSPARCNAPCVCWNCVCGATTATTTTSTSTMSTTTTWSSYIIRYDSMACAIPMPAFLLTIVVLSAFHASTAESHFVD